MPCLICTYLWKRPLPVRQTHSKQAYWAKCETRELPFVDSGFCCPQKKSLSGYAWIMHLAGLIQRAILWLFSFTWFCSFTKTATCLECRKQKMFITTTATAATQSKPQLLGKPTGGGWWNSLQIRRLTAMINTMLELSQLRWQCQQEWECSLWQDSSVASQGSTAIN